MERQTGTGGWCADNRHKDISLDMSKQTSFYFISAAQGRMNGLFWRKSNLLNIWGRIFARITFIFVFYYSIALKQRSIYPLQTHRFLPYSKVIGVTYYSKYEQSRVWLLLSTPHSGQVSRSVYGKFWSSANVIPRMRLTVFAQQDGHRYNDFPVTLLWTNSRKAAPERLASEPHS